MKERTVIHLHYLPDNTHHYFGSLANVFEFFTSEQLGVTYGSLRNIGLSENKPYINSKCIIRKGILLSKHGNRGKLSQKEFHNGKEKTAHSRYK